eukprot:CAMPEP_0113536452 /NCGR_PEP_ID=MMETSP0015_2-20120614/6266_1 /TAXON_ID=2838 /ORGANISM="Odontella" /LENGTH=418 /DNA_ID=CAMNT_0000435813 /DNA_START=159 /DNA_END=1415 /DNA_ORIENTATION=+ /assembly_acc=CAM_ASM_000160
MSLLPLFGVLLCAFGTVVNTAGMLCMKRASLRESDLPVYKRKFFWTGLVLLLVNSGGISLVVYAITPLGLTAPVNALTVVWGNLFSWRGWITGQREELNRRMVWANAVIVAGIVLTTTFGPKSGELPTLQAVADHVRTSGAIVFLVCAFLTIAKSMVKLFVLKPANLKDDRTAVTAVQRAPSSVELLQRGVPRSDEEERRSGADEAPAYDTNDQAPSSASNEDPVASEDPPSPPPAADSKADRRCSSHEFTIFLFPLSSALCASLAVVAFKCVSIYLAQLVSEGQGPNKWLALVLTLAIALSILNVVILNAGMEQSQASYFVSTYMTLTVIFTIVGGGLFYGEFAQVKAEGPGVVAGFIIGVAVSVAGISWLSYLQPPEKRKEAEEQADDMIDSEVLHSEFLADLSSSESDFWSNDIP